VREGYDAARACIEKNGVPRIHALPDGTAPHMSHMILG